MFSSDLYLITDRRACQGRPLFDLVEEAMKAGVRLLQYREKDLPFESRLETATRLQSICRTWGGTFVIDDDVDLALAVGADGVHLGQEDLSPTEARSRMGSGSIIGVTVRNLQQAQEAQKSGADYLGLGPIFASRTKWGGAPLGCDIIRKVRPHVSLPLYAIGGITPENATEVIGAGADGVALVAAILSHPRVGEAVRQLIELIRLVKQSNAG
jgi:thiamine-phosphate pyrophosphorylase